MYTKNLVTERKRKWSTVVWTNQQRPDVAISKLRISIINEHSGYFCFVLLFPFDARRIILVGKRFWNHICQSVLYVCCCVFLSSLVVSECGKNVNLLSQVTIVLLKLREINFLQSQFNPISLKWLFFKFKYKWEWIFVLSSLCGCWKADDLFT